MGGGGGGCWMEGVDGWRGLMDGGGWLGGGGLGGEGRLGGRVGGCW